MDFLVILKFLGALGVVLSLIGGCAFLASRFNLLAGFSARAGERRMKVQESLILDAKHRMMIVKADDREHIVLLGPSGDLHIESRDVAADDQTEADESLEPEEGPEPDEGVSFEPQTIFSLARLETGS